MKFNYVLLQEMHDIKHRQIDLQSHYSEKYKAVQVTRQPGSAETVEPKQSRPVEYNSTTYKSTKRNSEKPRKINVKKKNANEKLNEGNRKIASVKLSSNAESQRTEQTSFANNLSRTDESKSTQQPAAVSPGLSAVSENAPLRKSKEKSKIPVKKSSRRKPQQENLEAFAAIDAKATEHANMADDQEQGVQKPDVQKQEIQKQEVQKPEVENQEVRKPEAQKPEVRKSEDSIEVHQVFNIDHEPPGTSRDYPEIRRRFSAETPLTEKIKIAHGTKQKQQSVTERPTTNRSRRSEVNSEANVPSRMQARSNSGNRSPIDYVNEQRSLVQDAAYTNVDGGRENAYPDEDDVMEHKDPPPVRKSSLGNDGSSNSKSTHDVDSSSSEEEEDPDSQDDTDFQSNNDDELQSDTDDEEEEKKDIRN